MTQTVISGASAYCTPQQFLDRYDLRTVGRLLSDDGKSTLNQMQLLASPILASFLMEASGEVETVCLQGGRYTPADLAALAGTNHGMTLAGLVADLAMWRLWRRRPSKDDKAPASVEDARDLLQRLGDGEAIFGFQETADAGVLHAGRRHQRDETLLPPRYYGRGWDSDRGYGFGSGVGD